MNNIVSEISSHFYLNLIPCYLLLLINIICLILNKSCKKNIYLILINVISILSILSQQYFLGVLIDNQITPAYATIQINIITILLILCLILSIFIKIKNKK